MEEVGETRGPIRNTIRLIGDIMNYKHDKPYLQLLQDVLEDGIEKGDRTGTGTRSIFGGKLEFELWNDSIPLLTTKQMHIPSIIHEIIWYLSGDTNVKYLQDNGVRIWNEWADDNGDLGPVYGAQWRKWKKAVGVDYSTNPHPTVKYEDVDQIQNVIDTLYTNPDDRRMIVSAWNAGEIEDMQLPPCHAFFQFYSRELSLAEQNYLQKIYYDKKDRTVPWRALSCQLYQRSCDIFLGVPFNIAQYSILTHMIAHVTGHVAEKFIWTGGDIHLYNNHVEQAEIQLERNPYDSPQLELNEFVGGIDEFKYDDINITNYECHPTIKAKVSI